MNKFEPDELLNLAIMSKTPYVIVEGADDIQIYERISSNAKADCEIYSVEMIDGLTGGNDGVIQAIQAIESLPMPEGKEVKEFILGIIDSDARHYRNEIPSSSVIFKLNFYSIENHFASKSSIKPAINTLTRISSMDEVTVDSMINNIERNIHDIYYFSLEALKQSIFKDYNGVVGFSAQPGRRKNEGTKYDLLQKKDDLDQFAASLGLSPKLDSLQVFVKGKWLLTAFSEELFGEIEKLTIRCKNSYIKKCRLCERGNNGSCLFKVKEGFTKKSLYLTLMSFVDIPELNYIKEKFKEISASASAP